MAVQSTNEGSVHPHACGEHEARREAGEEDDGSSPRLWGTSFQMFFANRLLRFIPTPVGNMTLQNIPMLY